MNVSGDSRQWMLRDKQCASPCCCSTQPRVSADSLYTFARCSPIYLFFVVVVFFFSFVLFFQLSGLSFAFGTGRACSCVCASYTGACFPNLRRMYAREVLAEANMHNFWPGRALYVKHFGCNETFMPLAALFVEARERNPFCFLTQRDNAILLLNMLLYSMLYHRNIYSHILNLSSIYGHFC